MRAPSSLCSTTQLPSSVSASSSDSAGEASMGRSGRPTSSRNASRASAPPASAATAVSGNRPDSMNARRTVSPGTSAAEAIASSITPSSAPCRSSPVSRRRRKSCSASVARPNSAASRSTRRCAEPLPDVVATSPSAASTSATVSPACAAAGTDRSTTVRQPAPIRPCRGVPMRKDTTATTTSAVAPRTNADNALTLARRDRVAATAADVSTTSERSTDPWCTRALTFSGVAS